MRKHWFEVLTDSGHTMKIYFERQPRSRSSRSRRWLCTIDKSQEPNVGVQDSGRGA